MGRKKKWQTEPAGFFATGNCKLTDIMRDRKTDKKSSNNIKVEPVQDWQGGLEQLCRV